MIKGSCLCGAVSFEIQGSLHNARYCHCTNCRKFSGTGYAAWGLAETSQLAIAPPVPNVTKFNSGGGLGVFCVLRAVLLCGMNLRVGPSIGAFHWRRDRRRRRGRNPKSMFGPGPRYSWATIGDDLPPT